jgi:hypothetical protein
MAAVLAFSPDAVLSHRSAASLHGLRAALGALVDVTVARRARRRRGIRIHESRSLHRRDRTEIKGISVTAIPRTLLDLAEVPPATQLQRAYEQAERLRALDVVAIRDLLERSNGRRGVAALRRLLAYDPAAAAAAGSELELRFLDLVREAGLPPPKVNVLVEGFPALLARRESGFGRRSSPIQPEVGR